MKILSLKVRKILYTMNKLLIKKKIKNKLTESSTRWYFSVWPVLIGTDRCFNRIEISCLGVSAFVR